MAEETSNSQITEAQTALSNEPEASVESEVPAETEYACTPEMYEADWEDGLVQIDNVVFDTYKEWTLGEIVELFSSPQYQFSIKRISSDKREEPYDENGFVTSKTYVALCVKRNSTTLAQFNCWNPTDDYITLNNASFFDIAIELKEETPIWIANGIHPFELTFFNIEDAISSSSLEQHGTWYQLYTPYRDTLVHRYIFEFKTSDSTLEKFTLVTERK